MTLLPFTINNTRVVSSWTGGLDENTYVIAMPPLYADGGAAYKFKEWEDHSTDPVRTIYLNTDMNLKASYEVSSTRMPIVYTSPIVSSSQPDSVFAVNVTILNATELHDWEFTMYYDTRFMDVLSATEGPLLKSRGATIFQILEMDDAYNDSHGKTRLAGNLSDPTLSVSGNGTLAIINFASTTKGNSVLAFSDTKLNRPFSVPILHNALSGLGLIRVRMQPDINGDGIIDIYDLVYAALSFDLTKGMPGYKPEADISSPQDELIDIFDIAVIAVVFGASESGYP